MTAPLLPLPAGASPAEHPARPVSHPNGSSEGQGAICPVCGAAVTVDARFIERECGHAILQTADGALVSSRNLHVTRRKLSEWAYGSLAKAPGSEWRGAIIEQSVQPQRETRADLA